jgi:hypothetical protein
VEKKSHSHPPHTHAEPTYLRTRVELNLATDVSSSAVKDVDVHGQHTYVPVVDDRRCRMGTAVDRRPLCPSKPAPPSRNPIGYAVPAAGHLRCRMMLQTLDRLFYVGLPPSSASHGSWPSAHVAAASRYPSSAGRCCRSRTPRCPFFGLLGPPCHHRVKGRDVDDGKPNRNSSD